jgi:transcriptional regulator with XRE-family HTH domain
MSREKRLEDTQRAVVALRQHRQMTQQQFAVYLDVAITTVARWETFRPPSGPSLRRLREVAIEFGRLDLEDIFWSAIAMEVHRTSLPDDDPIQLLYLAIVRLHLEASRPQPKPTPTAMKAYRQVVSAIVKAHGAVADEIEAKMGGKDRWTDTDLLNTQLQLERLEKDQLKKSKEKNPNESK